MLVGLARLELNPLFMQSYYVDWFSSTRAKPSVHAVLVCSSGLAQPELNSLFMQS